MAEAGARACTAALLTVLLVGARPLAAQSQTDVLFHGSALSWSGSESRESGFVAGAYGTWGRDWKHYVEAGATYTGIDYLDGSRLDQLDLAAAYSRFWARGAVRVGGHLVETSDALTDGAVVVFGGASVYRPGVWSVGSEASLSRYGEYGSGLTVTQLTPSLGVSAGNAASGVGLGMTLRGYYVHHSLDTGLGGVDFYSGEAALSLTRGRLTVSGTGWLGEQAFAVRQGGFLVYNIAELHEGGFGGGARLVVGPKAALSAGVYVERVRNATLATTAELRSFAFAAGFTL